MSKLVVSLASGHGEQFKPGDEVVVFVGPPDDWLDGIFLNHSLHMGRAVYNVQLEPWTDYYGITHPSRSLWLPTPFRIHKGRLK